MLHESVWNMPVYGTINLNGSLLPAYRGAAPIQWAIFRGEKTTGVTTFLLQHQIDTGVIILQREIPILDEDDTGDLHDRMMYTGAALVLASVDQIAAGNIHLHHQDESKASHAPKIHLEDGHIVWNKSAGEIRNLIRGMSPFPGAWSFLDGVPLKIWKSSIHSDSREANPGSIRISGKAMLVQAADGELELMEVQMAGKKRMTAREFLNGYPIKDWSMT
jgi:methionyl-tRNA formyltransferase